MILLNSGVLKNMVVEAQVLSKKTNITIDVENKSASCRIDLVEQVAPMSYTGGMSNVHVSVDLGTDKPLVSSNNVTDVDAASAMAKEAIVKIREIALELGIEVNPQTV